MRRKIKVFLIIFGVITCLGISNSMIGKVSADMETAAQIAAEIIIKDWTYISTAYNAIANLNLDPYEYYVYQFMVDTTGAFGPCYLGFTTWTSIFSADGNIDFYIFDINGYFNWFYYGSIDDALVSYVGWSGASDEGAISSRPVNKWTPYYLVIDNDYGTGKIIDVSALYVINNPTMMMMLLILLAGTTLSANAPAQQQNLTWLWILITILAIAAPPAIIVPIVVSRKKTL